MTTLFAWIIPYRLVPQLVIQVSQTFGCIIKFPFCLLKWKYFWTFNISNLFLIIKTSFITNTEKSEWCHRQAVGLTGSPAASWQRCTRLSKVDLRTICSAGISFCSTLSAGNCWRSWAKQGNKYKVLTCLACVLFLRIQITAPCHTPTCTLGSCGAPGGTWAWSWGWGASTGNPITGAVMGAGGV